MPSEKTWDMWNCFSQGNMFTLQSLTLMWKCVSSVKVLFSFTILLSFDFPTCILWSLGFEGTKAACSRFSIHLWRSAESIPLIVPHFTHCPFSLNTLSSLSVAAVCGHSWTLVNRDQAQEKNAWQWKLVWWYKIKVRSDKMLSWKRERGSERASESLGIYITSVYHCPFCCY